MRSGDAPDPSRSGTCGGRCVIQYSKTNVIYYNGVGSVLIGGLLAAVVHGSCVARHVTDDDEAIGRAVKQALYDHDGANLLHVEPATHQGIVYLDGEVDQYVHKEEAERIARQVEGVKGVVNKVQVQP